MHSPAISLYLSGIMKLRGQTYTLSLGDLGRVRHAAQDAIASRFADAMAGLWQGDAA